MSLQQVLSEAFSGGRVVPVAQPPGIIMDEIRQVAGSRRAAARRTGIPESTLRRWERDGLPVKSRAAAQLRLETGLRGLYRVPDQSVTTVKVTIANAPKGSNQRDVAVREAAVRAAGDAWQRGDLVGMVAAFVAGIIDPWYRKVLFRPQAAGEGPRRGGGAGGGGSGGSGAGGGSGGYRYGDDGDDDHDDPYDDDLAYEGGDDDVPTSSPVAVGVGW